MSTPSGSPSELEGLDGEGRRVDELLTLVTGAVSGAQERLRDGGVDPDPSLPSHGYASGPARRDDRARRLDAIAAQLDEVLDLIRAR